MDTEPAPDRIYMGGVSSLFVFFSKGKSGEGKNYGTEKHSDPNFDRSGMVSSLRYNPAHAGH